MRLQLCEYAASNVDGTYTVIRGGIEHWTTESVPVGIALHALAEIPAGGLPAGETTLRLTTSDPAADNVFEIEGLIVVAPGENIVRFALPLVFVASVFGEYTFACSVGAQSASAKLTVRPKETPR